MDGMDFASSRPPVDQVDVVFRYLGNSASTLTAQEVAQIHGLGKAIAPTFEQGAAQSENGYGQGVADAQYAGTHANALGVPLDVWIWYAVDTGATEAMVRAYFQGIKAAGGRPAAMYGPMGTGLQLMAEGLVNGVWVANAASWSGYKFWTDLAAAARGSSAHVLQHTDHPLSGVDPNAYDFDEILKPFPAWGPNGTTNGPTQTSGDDVPAPTDCVGELSNQWGRWQVQADGGVFTKTGKFYGSYPGLPADRRQGTRYCVGIYNRPDGQPGYMLLFNDKSEYNFPDPNEPL